MVLQPTNKYQIIRYCHNLTNILNNDFQHHPFLFTEQMFCKHHFFGAKNNICDEKNV